MCVWCGIVRTDGHRFDCIERLMNETTVCSIRCMFMLDIRLSDRVRIRFREYCVFWYEMRFRWCTMVLSMYARHNDKMLFCIPTWRTEMWMSNMWKRQSYCWAIKNIFPFRFYLGRFKVHGFRWAVEGFCERFFLFSLFFYASLFMYCWLVEWMQFFSIPKPRVNNRLFIGLEITFA